MTDLARLPETGTVSVGLDLTRRLVAEGLGTGFLVIAVVGSGIMASRLSPNDPGLQLLENAAATAAALIGLILIFGAISGAHFNPVVTLVARALAVRDHRHRRVAAGHSRLCPDRSRKRRRVRGRDLDRWCLLVHVVD